MLSFNMLTLAVASATLSVNVLTLTVATATLGFIGEFNIRAPFVVF